MNGSPPLELVAQFVNTRDVSTGADELESLAGATAWLVGRDLVDDSFVLDEPAHADLLAFRSALHRLAHAHGGQALDAHTRAVLADLGQRVSLSIEVAEDGSLDLRSVGPGVLAPIGRLLSDVRDAANDGSLIRLKACAQDSCQWVFVDHSKNRSRRWCDMDTCGNVVNARAYRQRRRTPADA